MEPSDRIRNEGGDLGKGDPWPTEGITLEQLLEMRREPPPLPTNEGDRQKHQRCENVKAQRRAASKQSKKHKQRMRRTRR